MADVLNKTTKAYLRSVNTPDYPEDAWIINPDLSAVEGVPTCYWVIESSQVLVQEAYTETDPDTQQTITHDAVYETRWTVRAMTDVEKAAYDASIPKASNPYIQALDDGTPAYMYGDQMISINNTTLIFTLKVAGAKRFNVPFLSTGTSYEAERNRFIKGVHVTASGAAAFDVVLSVNGVEAERLQVSADKSVFDVAIKLNSGDKLTLSIESNEDVSNPAIIVDTATRN